MNALLSEVTRDGATQARPSGPELFEVDAATLYAWLEGDSVLLVDVRESHEFERERITGAFLVPMSRFDPETFPRVAGLKTVLVSEHGPRSAALTERLTEAGFADVYALTGGLDAWRAAGYELDE